MKLSLLIKLKEFFWFFIYIFYEMILWININNFFNKWGKKKFFEEINKKKKKKYYIYIYVD